MALFKKKQKIEETPEAPAAEAAAPVPAPVPKAQVAQLTSGRMSALFLKLYTWIFSVNITVDAYQIESGTAQAGDTPLPIRGYYHDLITTLSARVVDDQREEFEKFLSPDSIRHALNSGRSNLSGLFCAHDFSAAAPAVKDDDEDGTPDEVPLKWYTFRAEWSEEITAKNLLLVLRVTPARSDFDNSVPIAPKQSVDIKPGMPFEELEAARSQRLFNAGNALAFEYDVVNDTMYLHRTPGDESGDRVTPHFLYTLDSKGDWMVSHESLTDLRNLLRSDFDGGSASQVILYRTGGVMGAPFHHYEVTCAPLESSGDPTWILGQMVDVEEETLRRMQEAEATEQISALFNTFGIRLFQINLNYDRLYRIVQTETGFRREDNYRSLSEYINRRIENGAIAPESVQNYKDLLNENLVLRRTATGSWTFEGLLKEPGEMQARWYSDTVVPVKGRVNQYLCWRRDVNDAHVALDEAYSRREQMHLADNNSAMLDVMAGLLEFRSVESTEHVQHVRSITRILLEDVARRSDKYDLDRKTMELYIAASAMHDIGKITVPDHILNKPGLYTPEEYEQMKMHTVNGAKIVDKLHLPGQEDLKDAIRDVALHHHERYDGRGYPDGLVGDDIHIGVQAVSLADVYDALVSERVYKDDMDPSEALRMIFDGECGNFNPALLESLKACSQKILTVYSQTPGAAAE